MSETKSPQLEAAALIASAIYHMDAEPGTTLTASDVVFFARQLLEEWDEQVTSGEPET